MFLRNPTFARVARAVCMVIVAAPALWHVALEVRLFVARVRYPLDLEWLEGPVLYWTHRVMHGLPTFGPPEQGYLPLFHPPGHPVMLSLVGRVFGLDYTTGRAFSLAAFVFSAAVVVRSIARQERSRSDAWLTGALAVGCALAAVPLIGGFYDLVREDMAAFAVCALAVALADADRPRLSRRRIAGLAAVLTLAVFSRATSVFFAVWIVLYVFFRHRPSGLLVALSSLSLGAIVLVYVQLRSQGWYWMYTIAVNQRHAAYWDRCVEGLRMIHGYAPFALALLPAAIALALARRLSRRSVLWLGMAVFALPASLLPWSKRGGFYNDFLPIGFLIGPATVFLLMDGVHALSRYPRWAGALRWSGYVGLAAFLVVRARDPREAPDHQRLAPTAEETQRARTMNDLVAGLEGGVLVPRAPFLPVRHGDRAQQFSDMPYLDLVWSNFPGMNVGPYIDRIDARWALVTGGEVAHTAGEIAQRYQLERTIQNPPDTLLGDDIALRYLLRKGDDQSGARVVFDFEGPLTGWTSTGDAFERSPTPPGPSWQNYITGAVGHGVVNSYHPDKKDEATGTLVSPAFILDRRRLGLRVGGGWGGNTGVELRVGGRTAQRASTIFRETEAMTRVVWDVSAFAGQSAQLVIIDQDRGYWGHVTCDDVVLY
jgi:hypothetical protein